MSQKSFMHNAPAWFNQFDTEDINHLLVATDPISLTRTKIMSLPDTLTKMCSVSNKEIHPTIYHKDHGVWSAMLVQFKGMRPELFVNPEAHGFQYKLSESGILLPSVCAPLPSSVVSLLYQKENGEICIDRLY